MQTADTFVFYATFAIILLIGGTIATHNRTETRFNDPLTGIAGSIICMGAILMLIASIDDIPLSEYVTASIGTAILGTGFLFGGVLTVALSKYRSYDLVGLAFLALGTFILYEIGIFNPFLRGVLQEIHAAVVA